MILERKCATELLDMLAKRIGAEYAIVEPYCVWLIDKHENRHSQLYARDSRNKTFNILEISNAYSNLNLKHALERMLELSSIGCDIYARFVICGPADALFMKAGTTLDYLMVMRDLYLK